VSSSIAGAAWQGQRFDTCFRATGPSCPAHLFRLVADPVTLAFDGAIGVRYGLSAREVRSRSRRNPGRDFR
jgi:hypothetical protein